MKRALLLLSLLASTAQADPLPHGWLLAGSARESYLSGVDTAIKASGNGSGFLASKPGVDLHSEGFGTVLQRFAADAYRGRKVRFRARVRAQNVKGWAGLWMRVDGAGTPPATLAFDNMADRAIVGTSDWTPYEIVLDVPGDSTNISIGILLAGQGQVWIDDGSFAPAEGAAVEGGPEGLGFEP
ncbi:MAG TPA: hypothetical protein VGR02_22185 [Thermoanaerobaculia bacterium]|jgi:hypothetical protein|nr:hypothetical protein [Thermoanaerobaculia bacterium]